MGAERWQRVGPGGDRKPAIEAEGGVHPCLPGRVGSDWTRTDWKAAGWRSMPGARAAALLHYSRFLRS